MADHLYVILYGVSHVRCACGTSHGGVCIGARFGACMASPPAPAAACIHAAPTPLSRGRTTTRPWPHGRCCRRRTRCSSEWVGCDTWPGQARRGRARLYVHVYMHVRREPAVADSGRVTGGMRACMAPPASPAFHVFTASCTRQRRFRWASAHPNVQRRGTQSCTRMTRPAPHCGPQPPFLVTPRRPQRACPHARAHARRYFIAKGRRDAHEWAVRMALVPGEERPGAAASAGSHGEGQAGAVLLSNGYSTASRGSPVASSSTIGTAGASAAVGGGGAVVSGSMGAAAGARVEQDGGPRMHADVVGATASGSEGAGTAGSGGEAAGGGEPVQDGAGMARPQEGVALSDAAQAALSQAGVEGKGGAGGG